MSKTNKTKTNGKDGIEYEHMTEREHVLARPGMYIGGVGIVEDENWCINSVNKYEYKKMNYSPGFIRIFLEILMNAVDHSKRIGGKNMTRISVNIDVADGSVEIMNDGGGIDIVYAKGIDKKIYVPEMLFTYFRSSSNYNDNEERITSGTNGIGAKATVVFSNKFIVETVDGKRKKKFKQEYSNNLEVISDAKIKDCNDEPYTKIKFWADLERFGMKRIDSVTLSIMKKYVFDCIALTRTEIDIWWNEVRIIGNSFEDYCRLYVGADIPIVSGVSSGGGSIFSSGMKYEWKYCLCVNKTEIDGFRHVSFVNGMISREGGTHVDHIMKQVIEGLSTVANKGIKKGDVRVRDIDLRNNCMLFLMCDINQPDFGGQTKEKLTTPVKKFGCEIKVEPKFIKQCAKLKIIDMAKSFAQFKQSKLIGKTDGKMTRKIGFIDKLVDANWAGTKKSDECVLILTEGDSAKASIMSAISVVGTERYGVFPLKGKLLNVRDSSVKVISANEEIQNIKKILGLKTGMNYSVNSGNKLRYGCVRIITDADVDGIHIKGLIINFIECFWKSLLERSDFVDCMATPIMKVYRGSGKKQVCKEFYSLNDYEYWQKNIKKENEKWEVKYFKGLGTSTREEFREYFKEPKIVKYTWNGKKDASSLQLAFDKKFADERKLWLGKNNGGEIDYSREHMNYTEFVNEELVTFSHADNTRSLGCIMDGLKPSLRKIIYACFLKGFNGKSISGLKVAQLAGFVSEKTEYHHGEKSLMDAITGQAQNFIGSNNINVLKPIGQFGTRLEGGKDHASPRYIYTDFELWSLLIFNKLDEGILDYNYEEGQQIEPKMYLPIIPMVLINGCRGIGTGYSTEIPMYNPKDIIKELLAKINNENYKFKELVPWYRGFKGTIEKKSTGKYETTGTYENVTGGQKIIITELPIGTWTNKYVDFLDRNLLIGGKEKKTTGKKKDEGENTKKSAGKKKDDSNKRIIKDIINKSNDLDVRIEIEFSDSVNKLFNDTEIFYKIMKLRSSLSTENMYLFDIEGDITKYKNVRAIMNEYFGVRLDAYEKRKKWLLKKWLLDLKLAENRVRFIREVCDRKLVLGRRKRLEIENEMEKKKYYQNNDNGFDYLLSMPQYALTEERIEKYENEMKKIKNIVDELKKNTPGELWKKDLMELKKLLNL